MAYIISMHTKFSVPFQNEVFSESCPIEFSVTYARSLGNSLSLSENVKNLGSFPENAINKGIDEHYNLIMKKSLPILLKALDMQNFSSFLHRFIYSIGWKKFFLHQNIFLLML